jgi:hypothetical protein
MLSLVAVAAPDAGRASPRSLHVTARPATVKLGEPFTVEIAITHLPSQRYELGAVGELGDFELRRQERSRVDGPDASTTTLRVTLAAFALGKLTTPPLPLEVTEVDGEGRLEAPGTPVEVLSSLPADAEAKGADLFDVRPPEEVPVRTWRLLWGAAAALALALLGRWAYRAWRRRQAATPPAPPPEPLEVRALRRLDALKAQGLPERGGFKAYYFQLSEILRGYLGERFDFEALECTTPELLEVLEERHRPGLELELVRDFAWASDFARYAREEPSVEQCRQHLELCYRVVQATTAAVPRLPAKEAPRGAD